VRRWPRAAALAAGAGACALLLCACPARTPVPGDVVIGTFGFAVSRPPYQDGCQFVRDGGSGEPVMIDPEDFVATLSYTSGGPGARPAYFNSGATQIEGTLQADTLVVESKPVERDLPLPCAQDAGVCHGTLVERIEIRLLSAAQVEAGGCAAIGSVDAGPPPDPAPDGGVDVRLVCGWITDEFKPPGSCSCAPCLVVYAVSGERQ
jgi:hypothetical protein